VKNQNLFTLFANSDKAFENGLIIQDRYYAVHRFYDKENLIYGRSEELAPNDAGFAVIRGQKNGKTFYVLIIYTFPILSARAIPLLKKIIASNEFLSLLSL